MAKRNVPNDIIISEFISKVDTPYNIKSAPQNISVINQHGLLYPMEFLHPNYQ